MGQTTMDYSIKIGGEAGQGIQTIGDTLARVFSRTGYHVFSHQDYESRIRGGHNFYQVRLSNAPVSAPRDQVDIIVALDRESIVLHESELGENGRIIGDLATLKRKPEKKQFLDITFAGRVAGDEINGTAKIGEYSERELYARRTER